MKSAITIFTIGCLIFTGNLLSAEDGKPAATTQENKFNEAATKLLISQALSGTITPEKLTKLKQKNANIDAKYVRNGTETNLFLESVCFPESHHIKERMDGKYNFSQEYFNRQNVLTTLVDLGADTNVTDGNGMNALILAILNIGNDKYRSEIVRYLHKNAHVDANKEDNNGVTPLIYAIYTTNVLYRSEDGEVPSLVTYLVNAGADVNAADKEGTTALMYAAQVNTLETVKFLIRHGAKVSATNKRGRTAADFAKGRQHKKILKYLEEKMLDSL